MVTVLFYLGITIMMIGISGYYNKIITDEKLIKKNGPKRVTVHEVVISNRNYAVTILEKSYKEYVYIISTNNDYFKYYKNARYAIKLIIDSRDYHIIIDTDNSDPSEFVKTFGNKILEKLNEQLEEIGFSKINDRDLKLKLTSTILNFRYSD